MVYNPTPQYGSGTYGAVPGVITPPSPSADLSAQIPNLGAINASMFGNLLSESQGQIPQADQNFMQDQAAAGAAASGMPGTNIMPGTLEGNSAARNLGLLSYQLQQNAMNQYPGLTGAVSSTQTLNPQLQLEVAGTNALNAAAPNPQQAQSYAQQLYNQYLQSARGPGGGTGGASGPGAGTIPTSTASTASTAVGGGTMQPSTGTTSTDPLLAMGLGPINPDYAASLGTNALSGTGAYGLPAPGSMFTSQSILDSLLNPAVAGQGTVGAGAGGGYGQTLPANTVYNPQTDTTDYNPYGDTYGSY